MCKTREVQSALWNAFHCRAKGSFRDFIASEISVLAMLFIPSPLSGYLVRFWEHFRGIQTIQTLLLSYLQ